MNTNNKYGLFNYIFNNLNVNVSMQRDIPIYIEEDLDYCSNYDCNYKQNSWLNY